MREPYTLLNDLLQAKFRKAGRDSARFFINTTIGVFGLFDPATHFGLQSQPEDFGQTLAVWGAPPGAYVVLPFFGPSNARDAFSRLPEFGGSDAVNHVDKTETRWGAIGLRLVNARADLLGLDEVLELQPDQYLFLRENYRMRRAAQIRDGAADADEDDALEDALLE